MQTLRITHEQVANLRRTRDRPESAELTNDDHEETGAPQLSSSVDVCSLEPATTTLNEQENEVIRALCRELAASFRDAKLGDGKLLREIELQSRHLPSRISRRLVDFRRSGNDFETVLLRNLPIDRDLEDTPAQHKLEHWQQAPVATLTQLLVMAWLGDVISYADEKEGALVQDVVPVAGAEDQQENSGSIFLEVGYPFHCRTHSKIMMCRRVVCTIRARTPS